MTPLDLLLALARVSIVSIVALAFGSMLLRRRPQSVAGLSLTALLSCCILFALTGADWPTCWESSFGDDEVTFPVRSPDGDPQTDEQRSSPGRMTLAQIGDILRQLDRDGSPAVDVVVSWRWPALICLIAFPLGRLVPGILATLRIRRASHVVSDARLEGLTGQLLRSAGDAGGLTFRVSSQIHAPCVTMHDRHCVYLPEDWHEYSDDELAASVAHEFGHLQGNDARWRLLAQVASGVQFFHPLSHRLLRQLILGQELAADRRASRMVGQQRFVRGISQLALRLDANAALRQPVGFGVSHSSSLLIRRISMIRNGLHSENNGPATFLSGTTPALVVATAFVAGSWSLSASEPVRVAALTATDKTDGHTHSSAVPWETQPGQSGYWNLNVEAGLKHPVIGSWLRQGDAMFLESAWAAIANTDAIKTREQLGLTLDNLSSVNGTASFETYALDRTEEDNKNFRSSFQGGVFQLQLKRLVNWKAVGNAIARNRLQMAIDSLSAQDTDQPASTNAFASDILLSFFDDQSDSNDVVFGVDEDRSPQDTDATIPALWQAFSGNIATLVVLVPEMSGPVETPLQKLAERFHQSAHYSIVGVSSSKDPNNVSVRIGLSPRTGTTAADLEQIVDQFIETLIRESHEGTSPDLASAAMKAMLVRQLQDCQTQLVKLKGEVAGDAVVITLDMPASLLWEAITG